MAYPTRRDLHCDKVNRQPKNILVATQRRLQFPNVLATCCPSRLLLVPRDAFSSKHCHATVQLPNDGTAPVEQCRGQACQTGWECVGIVSHAVQDVIQRLQQTGDVLDLGPSLVDVPSKVLEAQERS